MILLHINPFDIKFDNVAGIISMCCGVYPVDPFQSGLNQSAKTLEKCSILFQNLTKICSESSVL